LKALKGKPFRKRKYKSVDESIEDYMKFSVMRSEQQFKQMMVRQQIFQNMMMMMMMTQGNQGNSFNTPVDLNFNISNDVEDDENDENDEDGKPYAL